MNTIRGSIQPGIRSSIVGGRNNVPGRNSDASFVMRNGVQFEKRIDNQNDPNSRVSFANDISRFVGTNGDAPNTNRGRGVQSPDDIFHADSFITLSHGVTAYRLTEPSSIIDNSTSNQDDVPLVICLHGLYNCSYMWTDSTDLLCDCEQGPVARILVFDFYGHGRSTWDGIPCTLDIFVDQAKELLDALGFHDKQVSVIGYDFGAAVATGFVAKYSEHTKSVTLIAPVGMRYSRKETDVYTRKSFLAKHVFKDQKTKILQCIKDDFVSLSLQNAQLQQAIDKYVDMIDWQIDNTPGFSNSIISTYKEFPLENMDELFAAIGRFVDLPCLIIWGTDDEVCPYDKCIEIVENCFQNTAFIIDVADCGHHPLIEQFDDTLNELLSFHKLVYDPDFNSSLQ